MGEHQVNYAKNQAQLKEQFAILAESVGLEPGCTHWHVGPRHSTDNQ